MKIKEIIAAIWLLLILGISGLCHATVSSETTRVKYTCNGTSTTYAYPFKILKDADLLVIKNLTATLADTTLVLNTNYTVTGAGSTGGGNVVLTTGSVCPSGYTLTILRNFGLTQETDYVDGEVFSAESFEAALDKSSMIQQQQSEAIGRSFKLPKTSSLTEPVLPNAVANNYIGWNASGTALEDKAAPVATTATAYEIDALISYGGGVNYTQATIQSALTAIGTSNNVTLLLRPGTWVISSNADWSAYTNVTFKIVPGAVISHGAFTVKIPIPAVGLYQWLSGPGLVTFYGRVLDIYAEWFGAAGDLSTDDAVPLQAAIASGAASNFPVTLLNKGYKSTVALTMSTNFQKLRGQGVASVIWGDHTGYVLTVGTGATERVGLTLEDLQVWSPTGKGILFTAVGKGSFRNLWSWAAGNNFVVDENNLITIFDHLTASANLYTFMRSMYANLPAVTSTAAGILVQRTTVESNALTFIAPNVEGVGGTGIRVIGTHTGITFIGPESEGNTGYGYEFNGGTGLLANLSVINGYAESNTAGAILTIQVICMELSGHYGSSGATTDLIALSGVSLSNFHEINAYGINIDVGTYPNVTDKYSFSSSNRFSNVSLNLASGGITGTAILYPQIYENVVWGQNVAYARFNKAIVETGEVLTLTVNSTNPVVTVGNLYKTANTAGGGTMYVGFTGGKIGQKITVFIGDALTSFDFSGTILKGNGGVDWTPASGDWLEAIFDGTNWNCAVHDTTL